MGFYILKGGAPRPQGRNPGANYENLLRIKSMIMADYE
jgi:hypothetical protein